MEKKTKIVLISVCSVLAVAGIVAGVVIGKAIQEVVLDFFRILVSTG